MSDRARHLRLEIAEAAGTNEEADAKGEERVIEGTRKSLK